MKLKNFYKIAVFSVVCLLSFSSCKKDNNGLGSEVKELLIGSWVETPQSVNYNLVVFFGRDDSFTMQYFIFGTPNYASTFTGTYKVTGDKLSVTINQLTSQESNKAPVTVKNTSEFFENATISVKNNSLVINYTSYPADGPVPTQLKLIKN